MKKASGTLKKTNMKTGVKTKKTNKKKDSKEILTKLVAKKSKKVSAKVPIKPKSPDLAHSPRHKKLNILNNFAEHNGAKVHVQESAVNNMANSDKIRRINSNHRRVITGAAIGKTGRITNK